MSCLSLLGPHLSFVISSFDFKDVSDKVQPVLRRMSEIFKKKVRIFNKIRSQMFLDTDSNEIEGRGLSVIFNVTTSSHILGWDTDEEYRLDLKSADSKNILAEIDAATIYGARHALETLSQLIGSLSSTTEETT